jgi:hypothetical protein
VREAHSFVREAYLVVIEQAKPVVGRGTEVIGELAGGEVGSGDSAVLVHGEAEVVVPELMVEPGPADGKVTLMLYGVKPRDVRPGATLHGPLTERRGRIATATSTLLPPSLSEALAWAKAEPAWETLSTQDKAEVLRFVGQGDEYQTARAYQVANLLAEGKPLRLAWLEFKAAAEELTTGFSP